MKQENSSIGCDFAVFTRSVYALDLTSTLERLVQVDKWHSKSAEAAIAQYRNFLILQCVAIFC
ncbi:MAG: hypothetical protein HKM04_03770 [Legionellales bacterium]|nr:hypothetical protein [Legionellales bacterium]